MLRDADPSVTLMSVPGPTAMFQYLSMWEISQTSCRKPMKSKQHQEHKVTPKNEAKTLKQTRSSYCFSADVAQPGCFASARGQCMLLQVHEQRYSLVALG